MYVLPRGIGDIFTLNDHVHDMLCSSDGASQDTAATINIYYLHLVLYYNAAHVDASRAQARILYDTLNREDKLWIESSSCHRTSRAAKPPALAGDLPIFAPFREKLPLSRF